MRKTRRDQLVVQLDDELFALSGKRAFRPRSVNEVRGDKWFLTDLGGVEGQVTQVDSPPKYAGFVILRRLVENGELDQTDRVLIHWKHKRDRTSTEAFFTPARADAYQDALREAEEDAAQQLVFPFNAALLAGLQEYGARGVVALLFEHGRHVDMIVGRNGQPLRFSRMSAYSGEARQALAQSVDTELRGIQSELRVELEAVVYGGWRVIQEEGLRSGGFGGEGGETTDSPSANIAVGGWGAGAGGHALETSMGSEWVRQMARDMEVTCTVLPISRFDLGDGEALLTSLPAITERMPASLTISPQPAYWAYAAQRTAPWVASVAWAGVGGLFAATVWLQTEATAMDAEIDRLATAMDVDVRDIPELPERHEAIVAFTAELDRLREAHAPKNVLADLSDAAGGGLRMRSFRMQYDDAMQASLHLQGVVQSDFEEATETHRRFISAMEGMGYEVEDSDLRSDVDRLDFQLTFRVPDEREGRR